MGLSVNKITNYIHVLDTVTESFLFICTQQPRKIMKLLLSIAVPRKALRYRICCYKIAPQAKFQLHRTFNREVVLVSGCGFVDAKKSLCQ